MDDTAKNTEPEARTFEPKPAKLSDVVGAGMGAHSTPETRAVPQPESGEAPAEKRRKESGG